MENAETLTRIAEELEAKLRPLGFARERRKFHPHLTLARVRSKPPDELKTLVTRHESTELGDVAIGAVELLQSDLRPDGPRYTVLESAELTKPQA